MPIVSIDLAWLNRLLGKEYPTETLRESLDQIGCDVEDVVEVGSRGARSAARWWRIRSGRRK